MRKLLTATAVPIMLFNYTLNSNNQLLVQASDTDLYNFKSFKNFEEEYKLKYEEVQIQKEIQKQLELERQRQEELERQKQEELERQRIAEEKKKVITYNPHNLLEPSNITREQAYQMLEGKALQTLSNAYVYMEELYGVNAIYLMALSAEESAWGRSELAITKNNIGGIKATDGSWRYFNSWGDCLDYKARLLKNQYLSENGCYYNGLSIWDVNEMYCEQKTWSDNINNIANDLINKINK